MQLAILEAKKCKKTDDVPVGAVIVENGKIIAKAHNTKEKTKSAIAHAEINAVEKACKKKKNWHLNECEMYVTLEPCPMCLGAIKEARIKKVTYAVSRDKKNTLNNPKMILGTQTKESKTILKSFFENKRK